MSNKKTKWTEENEVFLLKLISDNVNLEKISKKVKKTESEIIHKLKKVASKMLSENKSKDDIIKLLKFIRNLLFFFFLLLIIFIESIIINLTRI